MGLFFLSVFCFSIRLNTFSLLYKHERKHIKVSKAVLTSAILIFSCMSMERFLECKPASPSITDWLAVLWPPAPPAFRFLISRAILESIIT
jgi:hypothetical protein